MLGYDAKVHIYFLKHLIFSFKARGGLQRKIVPCKTPRRLTLRGVRLHAVLNTFGSAVNLIVDSAQCQPARSPTPRSVSQFWILEIFEIFSKYSITIWILNSLEIEIFENLKNVFDSEQCQPAQSPTLRSVSLRKNNFFANISSKTNFQQNHFSLFIRDGFDS